MTGFFFISLLKTFRVATDHACECRGKLVRLIGEELTKLDPPELCTVSPSILHDIVVNASDKDDETSTRSISERVCKLVDTYLAQMAKEVRLSIIIKIFENLLPSGKSQR